MVGKKKLALILSGLLVMTGLMSCSSNNSSEKGKNATKASETTNEDGKTYTIGINQLVQHDALDASREVESIYKEIDTGDNKKQTILEKIEDESSHEVMVINRIMVKQLLETLEDTDRKIIILRYFQNKTQSEIANIVGMTQVQVSRTEKKILEKLKKQIV